MKTLTIVKHRHLAELTLSGLDGINVIVGPNNIGKTTLLRAVLSAVKRDGGLGPSKVMVEYSLPRCRFDGTFWVGTCLESGRAKAAGGGSERFWRTDRPSIFQSMQHARDLPGGYRRGSGFLIGSPPSDVLAVLESVKEDVRSELEAQQRRDVDLLLGSFFLWHRRKSNYVVTPEVAGKLLPEGENLTQRLQTFMPHEPEETAKIQGIIDRVLPGTGRLAVAPVGRGNEVQVVFRTQGQDVALADMGGGVEQVLVLATALIAEPRDAPIFIEEPETHLHPTAQNSLMEELARHRGDRQIFITTHSASIINRRDPCVRIFQLHRSVEGNTEVRACRANADLRHALDGIGARPSDLLQSNSVVWVEGPTEAVIVPYLIRVVDPELREHVHYELMFTGGSLLAHLGGDVGEDGPGVGEKEMRDIFGLCLHNFGIFDRDAEVGAEPSKADVVRMVALLGEDVAHVTRGYEFEWYYPEAVASEVFAKMPKNGDVYRAGEGAYSMPFYKFMNGERFLAESTGKRGKVDYAEKMVSATRASDMEWSWFEGEQGEDLKRLLAKLTAFIRKANGLSEADVQIPLRPDAS